jgi:diadenylate cyclase
MQDFLANLRSSFRQEDLLDVAIVAFIVYRLLNMIRGTRAVQMLIGLGILTAGFFLSSQFELYATHWLLSNFFDYFVFIIIVLFQDDLRRALTRMGKNPLASTESENQIEMVDEVARAATQMARDGIGSLIVIERDTGLKNFMDTGSKVDSKVRAELLYSMFLPDSPLHDGAVIVNGDRLAAAGCFLPLSKNPDLDRQMGTRHRAAIGLTEETDAIVVLVSEEAGKVHLVQSGEIVQNLTEIQLRDTLAEILNLDSTREPLPMRIRRFLSAVRGKGGVDS